jgi:hypothetical protein
MRMRMMPKPICVTCKRFFKPARNGQIVLEQMPAREGVQPGVGDEEGWRPYKLWMADLMRCDGCGTEIVYGFGMNPLSEHYREGFEEWLEVSRDGMVVVNDC